MQLRDYQQTLVDEVRAQWAAGKRNVLAVAPTGAGKCLGRGTPVMLFDGSVVPVENIRVGDALRGPDGLPRLVVSLARGRETMFRVAQSRGDPYVVNASHILSFRREGEVVNMRAADVVRLGRQERNALRGWRVESGQPAAHDVMLAELAENDYFGFEIAGPDRLFLLGDGTVTHNTVVFSHILSQEPGASVAIAHRQELVSQISLALARNGVRHRIIGPASVARNCVTIHTGELGRHYIDAGARCAVAGVQTLVRRDPAADPWFNQVRRFILDEGHHATATNSFGTACAMFPNAEGLLVTATPGRADGLGLGRRTLGGSGIVDAMVEAPGMRELIHRGFLTEYRVFARKTSDLDLSPENVPLSAGGDFSPVKLRGAVHKSHIVGDVVEHYKSLAMGKLGVTFAVDVESATELMRAYRDAGVPAELVTAQTPDLLRMQIQRRFRNRELLQLVNVDLFGEGYDLPAIEVVSMARPTQSFALYAQQFGRALRLMEGKERAIIIDHVGNVQRHGLPDAPRKHSLADRERRSGTNAPNDTIPIAVCLECTSAYEAFHKACPYCGAVRQPAGRSAPKQVDGVLEELDPDVLAALRGEVAARDLAQPAFHPDPRVHGVNRNRAHARRESQEALRRAMKTWGGYQTHLGRNNDEAQRRFYFRYNIDTMSAWLLDREEADRLRQWIEADLAAENVVELIT